MAGLYFDDFHIGQTFAHAITRTVTETDNLLFCALTHNPQPLHLDAEFGKTTEFGRQIVNSIFTFGLMIGVSVGDTTLGTTIANLGMTDVRFSHPVFIGDTLRSESKVAEIRESKSRPGAGIVVFEHRSFNQRGEEVAYCKRSALMRKREGK
jgi:acyl dehydratase